MKEPSDLRVSLPQVERKPHFGMISRMLRYGFMMSVMCLYRDSSGFMRSVSRRWSRRFRQSSPRRGDATQ